MAGGSEHLDLMSAVGERAASGIHAWCLLPDSLRVESKCRTSEGDRRRGEPLGAENPHRGRQKWSGVRSRREVEKNHGACSPLSCSVGCSIRSPGLNETTIAKQIKRRLRFCVLGEDAVLEEKGDESTRQSDGEKSQEGEDEE